jgi:hypothetical protein
MESAERANSGNNCRNNDRNTRKILHYLNFRFSAIARCIGFS